MSYVAPELAAPVQAFATSLGIGLLIGMERERRVDSAAGLRTYALVCMLGCLFALLTEKTGGPWALIAGLVVVALAMVASNFSSRQEEQYRGFTSEAAIIVTYGLGAAVWFGYSTLAVMIAITTTILLYFKAELRRISERMTAKDINSMLQFAVLSLVILPILPNADFGPYNAINPRQVWWMVVLISGLALGGYMALRMIGARHGATLLGLIRHHGTDPDHFLRATHEFPDLKRMVVFERPVIHALRRLPGRKIIFSNAPRHYTAAILAITGLGCCFDAVYSVESVGYRPKPMPSGFRALLRAERLDPRRCIMVEDSLANLVAAKKLGMKTVWVSAGCRRSPSVDAKITSVLELPSRCGRL